MYFFFFLNSVKNERSAVERLYWRSHRLNVFKRHTRRRWRASISITFCRFCCSLNAIYYNALCLFICQCKSFSETCGTVVLDVPMLSSFGSSSSSHLCFSSANKTSSARGSLLPGNSPECMIKTLISNLSPERLMWLRSLWCSAEQLGWTVTQQLHTCQMDLYCEMKHLVRGVGLRHRPQLDIELHLQNVILCHGSNLCSHNRDHLGIFGGITLLLPPSDSAALVFCLLCHDSRSK